MTVGSPSQTNDPKLKALVDAALDARLEQCPLLRRLDPRVILITISSPSGASPVTATPDSPGSCSGSIVVDGTASLDQADLVSISVRVNGGSPVFIAPADVVNGHWQTTVGGVECVCPHLGQDGNNLVEATAEWEIGGEYVTESDSRSFTATCPGAGSSSSSSSSSSSGASSSSSSSSSSGRAAQPLLAPRRSGVQSVALQVEPFAVEHGWLGYRNLLTQHPFDLGTMLYHNGRPLVATTIAVFAADVCWYHQRDLRRAVRRPSGTLEAVRRGFTIPKGPKKVTIGAEPFRFPTAPKLSICVYQSGSAGCHGEVVHAVESRTKDAPDMFGVRPDQPILVRVNDSRHPIALNSGDFTLWVKVVG